MCFSFALRNLRKLELLKRQSLADAQEIRFKSGANPHLKVNLDGSHRSEIHCSEVISICDGSG
jgi:hypothetical protein